MRPDDRRPYLELYREEKFMQDFVWRELFDLGPLEEGTELWQEAYAVARETMKRARTNVELIVEHLQRTGYHFSDMAIDDSEPLTPWSPPPAETPELLVHVAERIGPIPLALRAWWESVGEVSLQGYFPDIFRETGELPMGDPLMVGPLSYVLTEFDEWEEETEAGEEEGGPEQFEASLAPDIYHKAGYSGGPAYKVVLPDARADVPLLYVILPLPGPPLPNGSSDRGTGVRVELKETFVSYLRRSFDWAGFPGYAVRGRDPVSEREIARLQPLFERMLPI